MNVKTLIPLLAICCLSISVPAMAVENVGRVIYVSGEVYAQQNGKTRPLRRGSPIHEGDTVVTRPASRSQIRMTDGALFALRPDTRMNFENYRYNQQNRTGSSILSLIKGGFRTITGLIGRFSKKHYRVRTTVATIGVRGTHYGLTLCQQGDCADNGNDLEDGLYGSVVDGEIVAQNDAGEFHFTNDQYFHVSSATSRPRSLIKPPGVIFGQSRMARHKTGRRMMKTALKAGDATHNMLEQKQDYTRNRIERVTYEAGLDADNNINLVTAKAGSGATFSFFPVYINGVFGESTKIEEDGGPLDAIILNIGKNNTVPVTFEQNSLNGGTRLLALGNASIVDTGTLSVGNSTIHWGRWGRKYVAAENGTLLNHRGPLHYALSNNITTPEQLASLQVSSNGQVDYSSVAGTRPTDLAGNVAVRFADVQMRADFGAGSIDYSVSTTVGNNDYIASGSTSLPVALNNGINLIESTNPVTNSVNTATGNASLSFIGKDAGAAITSFTLQHNFTALPDDTPNQVSGSAVLTRGGVVPGAAGL